MAVGVVDTDVRLCTKILKTIYNKFDILSKLDNNKRFMQKHT